MTVPRNPIADIIFTRMSDASPSRQVYRPMGLTVAAQRPWTMIACTSDRQRGAAVPTDVEDSLANAMAAAQDGDADAYRQLLRHCIPFIANVARASGFRDAAVEDIVQETLLTIHRVRHTYDPARPFLPWLRAIARRRAIDAIRQRTRHRAEVWDQDRYNDYPDQSQTAEQTLDQQDRKRRLASAMATLPEAQRQAVTQLATSGNSLSEATVTTGRSKGALKVNLHRAIKALRNKLGQDSNDD
jgi:RNA polymerase sigma factor (sigma-70 family)